MIALIENYIKFLPLVYIAITAGLIFGLSNGRVKRFIKPAVIFVLISITLKIILEFFGQYYIWMHGDASRGLLPPYTSINYFLGYCAYHFAWPVIAAILVGWIFIVLAKILNKRFDQRFFEDDEPWHLIYGLIIVGHPYWIFYIFAVIGFAVVFYLFNLIFKKMRFGQVFSLYRFWIPIALIVMVFSEWIIKIPFLQSLKF
ncbi:MAG TPA: hypothetical protein PLQ44_02210 [Candidatus Paceibacterota bacterium]|nr:hypothetical protein [Candidatus Paceibacterota bacterium]HPT40393.1 hypothetical protein [Candidatus Paceibacterota bacterium]